ncbi:hypothetical protein H4Q32_029422 [Labeo rohita]|uniref:DDE Tnp4 domain-containing protein n=1 Tax=Labeo rohita TaxID=84645 RepID=A0ABQ8L8F9_LABRO|nr:hypothetical protein H4Q32_029422 [Labeo rohita]
MWLLTPLSNPQTDRERRYNDAHSRTRSVVERAIGQLKCRWRCLDRTRGILLYRPNKMCRIVLACGVLHNATHMHSVRWWHRRQMTRPRTSLCPYAMFQYEFSASLCT